MVRWNPVTQPENIRARLIELFDTKAARYPDPIRRTPNGQVFVIPWAHIAEQLRNGEDVDLPGSQLPADLRPPGWHPSTRYRLTGDTLAPAPDNIDRP